VNTAETFVAGLLSDFREARNIAGCMGNRKGSGYIAYVKRMEGMKRDSQLENFKGDRDRERGKSNLF